MDHGNFYECFTTGGRSLVVLGQSPAAVEPTEGPLHDPTLGLRHEANLTYQLLNYHSQPAPADPGMTQGCIEVGVAPDLLQPLDRLSQPLHQGDAADAVLNRGRNYHQRPQKTQGINRYKPLASDDFFSPHRPHAGRLARCFSPIGYRRWPRSVWAFADSLANLGAQGVVNSVPGAVLLPETEVVESDTVRRKIVGQRPPDTTVAGLVEDGV